MAETNEIKKNSLKAWILASRPRTLTSAITPVMIALTAAYIQGAWCWPTAVLCTLFAMIMQIDANFVNDYYDFKNGIDDETRLGPKRACAEGWIDLKAMERGLIVTTLLAALVGLPLICWGGWPMIAIGLACIAFCFLYTTWLSKLGLGDVLVIVFFGLVPVLGTYYLQCLNITPQVVYLALATGLCIDTLLIVNNYRDCEGDAHVGKKTLVVFIGKHRAEWLYLTLGLVASLLVFLSIPPHHNMGASAIMLFYIVLHVKTFKTMRTINQGRELNKVLGHTARNILAFAITACATLLLSN